MINTVVNSVVALIGTALPLYKKVDPFYTPVKNVDAGKFPHAMVYDPAVVSTSLRDRQDEQVVSLICLLVREKDNGIGMRDDLDAIVAALRADPTLSATVDDARAVGWRSAENQTSATTGGLEIEVKLVE